MDLLNYVISLAILALAIQFGEFWMGLGATLIVIIASKSFKATILLSLSFGIFYFLNAIGIKEYWLFAVMGLVALGYLIGLGNDEKPADPYAGLLGGDMGGLGGMGGMG